MGRDEVREAVGREFCVAGCRVCLGEVSSLENLL